MEPESVEEMKKARRRSICYRELLLAASEADAQEVKRLLSEQNADVNFVDANGCTPLHWAAVGKSEKIVDLLLAEKNINVSAENNVFLTALDWAQHGAEIAIQSKIRENARDILSRHQCFLPLKTVTDILETFCEKLPSCPEDSFKGFLCIETHTRRLNLYHDSSNKRLFHDWNKKGEGEEGDVVLINASLVLMVRDICKWVQKNQNDPKNPEKIIELREIHDDYETSQQCRKLLSDSTKKKQQNATNFVDATEMENFQYDLDDETFGGILEILCPHLQTPVPSGYEPFVAFQINDVNWVTLYQTTPCTLFHVIGERVAKKKHLIEVGASEHDPKVSVLLHVRSVCLEALEKKNEKKKTTYTPPSEQATMEGRRFFKDLLLEIKKTKDKIKSFLTLIKVTDTDNEFTFRGANITIQFLEIFALADVYTTIPLEKIVKKSMITLKKSYFERHFDLEKKDIQTISRLRSFFVHARKGPLQFIMEPSFFNHLKPANVPHSDFMKGLKTFGETVLKKIEREVGVDNIERKPLFVPVDESAGQGVLRQDNTEMFKKILARFSKNAEEVMSSNVDSLKDELYFELYFDLVINIFPKVDSTSSRVKPQKLVLLRNKLVHAFQNIYIKKYEIYIKDIRKGLTLAIPQLYRCYLAENIYDSLGKLKIESTPDEIREKLMKVISDVKETFTSSGKYLTSHQKENSYGEGREIAHIDRNDDEVSVKTYLRYLAPLLDCEDSATNEGEDTPAKRVVVEGIEKRKILEDIIDIENKQNPSDSELRRQEVRKYLQDAGHDDEDAIAIQSTDDERKLEDTAHEIMHIIQSLRSLSSQKELQSYNILPTDIGLLYENFLRSQHSNNFDEYHKPRFMEYYKVGDIQFKIIQQTFDSLVLLNVERTLPGEKELKINVSRVALSLLDILEQNYQWYEVNIPTLKSAFDDNVFVNYLVLCDQLDGKIAPSTILDIYRRLRVIRHVDETYTYVSHLVSKIGSAEIIETKHLKSILLMNLKKEAFSHTKNKPSYLEELVKLSQDKRCDERVEKAISMILFNHRHDVEILRCLMNKLGSVQNYLKYEKNYPKEEKKKLIIAFLGVANDLILDFIRKEDFSRAESLIKEAEDLEKGLDESNESIQSRRKLHKAKLLIAQALRETSLQKVEEAMKILKSVPGNETDADVMLALSRQAYSQSVLVKIFRKRSLSKEAEDYANALRASRDYYEKLWKRIVNIIRVEENTPFAKVYREAQRCRSYRLIVDLSAEHKKYLDVLSVQTSVLLSRFYYVQSRTDASPQKLKSFLQEWDEVYKIRREEVTDDISKHVSDLVLRKKAHVHASLARHYYQNNYITKGIHHNCKALELHVLIYNKAVKWMGYHSKNMKRFVDAVSVSFFHATEYEKRIKIKKY